MWMPEDMASVAAVIDPDMAILSPHPQPDRVGVAFGAALLEPPAAAAEPGPAVADVAPDPAGEQLGQLADHVARLESQVGRCLSVAIMRGDLVGETAAACMSLGTC
jgi:hypothetical protein